jgi:hypothetical protein
MFPEEVEECHSLFWIKYRVLYFHLYVSGSVSCECMVSYDACQFKGVYKWSSFRMSCLHGHIAHFIYLRNVSKEVKLHSEPLWLFKDTWFLICYVREHWAADNSRQWTKQSQLKLFAAANIYDFYLQDTWFGYTPEHSLLWLRSFMAFLSFSCRCQGRILKQATNVSFPVHFGFNIAS